MAGMVGLAGFNALPPPEAVGRLRPCCATPGWAERVAAGRPYGSVADLRAAGEAELAGLAWPDIEEALAAHPRIGARVAGAGREAEWSRREQAGTAASGTAVLTALREANEEYERRFGHVFLIYATGRTDTEMLAAARARLGNPVEVERQVVREELARIVALRLERLVQ